MKLVIIICSLLLLAACNADAGRKKQDAIIDSLKESLRNSYKPGLGEFMVSIQLHHAKLWFAGINENWPLASFELNELIESEDAIKKYCADRPEVKHITMIDGALDFLKKAIDQKNTDSFRMNFITLTENCNNCHHHTDHPFNKVIIPTAPPVTNQDFKPDTSTGN